MKTYLTSPVASTATPRASRLSFPGRAILATICALLVSFAAAPSAIAGPPDGEYKFVKASGWITVMGETQEIPQDALKDLTAITNSSIVIKDRKLKLNRKAAAKIINQLSDELDVPIDVTITGPSYLKLKKSGTSWVGKTSTPVVVTFSGSYAGQDFSGNLKTNFNATVKGKKLTLKVPITGRILGYNLKAQATVICTR